MPVGLRMRLDGGQKVFSVHGRYLPMKFNLTIPSAPASMLEIDMEAAQLFRHSLFLPRYALSITSTTMSASTATEYAGNILDQSGKAIYGNLRVFRPSTALSGHLMDRRVQILMQRGSLE